MISHYPWPFIVPPQEALITTTSITSEVGPGAYFVQGPASNWVILTSGGEVSLIDCGYPGDWAELKESLRGVGFGPDDVSRLFVTHSHSDHIGSAERLRRHHGTEVLACAQEALHARRLVLHQVTREEVVAYAADPLVQAWMEHAIAAGGLEDVTVATVTEIPEGVAAPGPHGPIPHVMSGHTPGHTVFELASVGALVTGDALVTGHATSSKVGPQMLHPMFHTDLARAESSLQLFSQLDARVILPGHGEPLSMSPTAAVHAALSQVREQSVAMGQGQQ